MNGKLYFLGRDITNDVSQDICIYNPSKPYQPGTQGNPKFVTLHKGLRENIKFISFNTLENKIYYTLIDKTDNDSIKRQIWIFDPVDESVEMMTSESVLDNLTISRFQFNSLSGKDFYNYRTLVVNNNTTILNYNDEYDINNNALNDTVNLYSLGSNLTKIGSKFYFVGENKNSGKEIKVYDPTDL